MHDLSNGEFSLNKSIKFKISVLRLDFCGYGNACFVIKGTIIVEGTNENNRTDKKLAIKNNVPFRSCISKISCTVIGSADDLDIVVPMYNLLDMVAVILRHWEVCKIIIDMK